MFESLYQIIHSSIDEDGWSPLVSNHPFLPDFTQHHIQTDKAKAARNVVARRSGWWKNKLICS